MEFDRERWVRRIKNTSDQLPEIVLLDQFRCVNEHGWPASGELGRTGRRDRPLCQPGTQDNALLLQFGHLASQFPPGHCLTGPVRRHSALGDKSPPQFTEALYPILRAGQLINDSEQPVVSAGRSRWPSSRISTRWKTSRESQRRPHARPPKQPHDRPVQL